jgi:hypothetical protein
MGTSRKKKPTINMEAWQPRPSEYWYIEINDDGDIYSLGDEWSDSEADNLRWSMGNCYKSEEIAEEAVNAVIEVMKSIAAKQ